MFGMIRNTHELSPQHTVVAYSDNASVMEGGEVERWLPEGFTNAPAYRARSEALPRADEGGDAQPPDRDLAVSRAPPPAPAARSATRARPAAAPSPRPA